MSACNRDHLILTAWSWLFTLHLRQHSLRAEFLLCSQSLTFLVCLHQEAYYDMWTPLILYTITGGFISQPSLSRAEKRRWISTGPQISPKPCVGNEGADARPSGQGGCVACSCHIVHKQLGGHPLMIQVWIWRHRAPGTAQAGILCSGVFHWHCCGQRHHCLLFQLLLPVFTYNFS